MNDAVNNDALNKSESQEVDSLPIDFGGLDMPDTLPDASVNIIKMGCWSTLSVPSPGVYFMIGLTNPKNKDVFWLGIYDANNQKFESQDAWLTSKFGGQLSITVDGYKLEAQAELETSNQLDVKASYTNPAGRTFNIPKNYTIK